MNKLREWWTKPHWWKYVRGMQGHCPRMQVFPGEKPIMFQYCTRKRHLSWRQCRYGPYTEFDWMGYLR